MGDYIHPLAEPFRLDGELPESVLLIHGWTGSPAHLRDLGSKLHEAGYTVAAPLLAGHGTSPADMVETGWRDWVRSATEAALELRSGGGSLHLVGLSMGGVIALLQAPVLGAASVTTINAPQVVRNRRARLATLYRGSSRIDEGDPLVPAPAEMRRYQQQYDVRPVGTAADLMDLVLAARHNLWRVQCPALVIQSKTDETVNPKSAEIIYDGLGSKEKGLIWLEKSQHVATLDTERDAIASAILEHLEAASA